MDSPNPDTQGIRKISSSGVVTTLAGSGTAGTTDGAGTSAQFSGPQGVSVDGAGNVYVADTSNALIRKVSPSGFVTTLAGSTYGYADGPGTTAQFRAPTGVAADGAGNVLVADSANRRIRMISPTGVVTTFAGSGTSGSSDGVGAAARFSSMNGIAVDGAGNIFVADSSNNRIRKISPAAVVTTIAGSGTYGNADGTGLAAQSAGPYGLAIDTVGNVYVADPGFERIRRVSSTAAVTTVAGSTYGYLDGIAAQARFNSAYGVAVDAGWTLFVADTDNHRTRRIEQ